MPTAHRSDPDRSASILASLLTVLSSSGQPNIFFGIRVHLIENRLRIVGNAMAAYLGRPVAAALAAVRRACVTAALPCALRLHRCLCSRLRAKRLERCA